MKNDYFYCGVRTHPYIYFYDFYGCVLPVKSLSSGIFVISPQVNCRSAWFATGIRSGCFSPGDHFTNDLTIIIQIQPKFFLTLTQIMLLGSLQIFAHDTTVSCRGMRKSLWWCGSQQFNRNYKELPSNLKDAQNVLSDMGTRMGSLKPFPCKIGLPWENTDICSCSIAHHLIQPCVIHNAIAEQLCILVKPRLSYFVLD